MLAISDPEVQLPTLTMNSDQLAGITSTSSEAPFSLSGIIKEFGMNIPDQPDQQQQQSTISVPAGTVPGQEQGFTIQLLPTTDQQQAPRDMLDNLRGFPQQQQQQQQHQQQDLMQLINSQPAAAAPTEPHVVIVEQPASHKLRFRYECEGRGAGALQGATSSAEKKTFPKIQIRGYTGPAVVVVSCVTHDSDKPKAHPHMLVSPASVGRDGCKKGVCTQHVSSSDMTVEFQHLGIQCKRKRDIQKALDERKSIRVDPFRQGFEHANSPGNIDLNAVRLCFQAFLENPETPGKFTRVVPPVCSKPIFDAKAKKELQIMDMSRNTSPAEGGKKLIILCERVSRDDIKVRFFQDSTGWEAYGEFKPEDVHKQYAISLSVPPYMDGNISENQQVWIELTKADGSTSEPTEFIYTPSGQVADRVGGPKQVELSRRVEPVPSPQSKPVNMYNGGSVTNIKSERKIKVERAEAETSWAAMVNGVNQTQGPRPVVAPYSQVVPTNGGGLVLGNNVQFTSPQTNSELADLNQVLAAQEYCQYGSPYSDNSQSSYDNNMPQQSPDPQGLANMNIASPIGIQSPDPTIESILGTEHGEVENMSQELKGLSFESPGTNFVEPLNIEAAQQQQQRSAGKRSAKGAELESGSNVVPRQMERQQSNTLHTPNISNTLSTGDVKFTSGDLRDLSAVLKNCPEVNQL